MLVLSTNHTVFHFNFFLVNPIEPSRRAQTKSNLRGREKKAWQMQVQADKKNQIFQIAFFISSRLELTYLT